MTFLKIYTVMRQSPVRDSAEAKLITVSDSAEAKLSPVRDGKKSKLSGVLLDSTETMLSAVQECNLSKLSTVRYTVELSSVLDSAKRKPSQALPCPEQC